MHTGSSRRGWGIVVVRGRSMLPALRENDRVVVRWSSKGARPDRIAVVRLPHRPLSIKRLTFRTDGGWWVERDNPEVGVDSWHLGAVPDHDLVAVALFRLWPSPGRIARPPEQP